MQGITRHANTDPHLNPGSDIKPLMQSLDDGNASNSNVLCTLHI